MFTRTRSDPGFLTCLATAGEDAILSSQPLKEDEQGGGSMKRAAIYCRVGGVEKAHQRSLDVQEASCVKVV